MESEKSTNPALNWERVLHMLVLTVAYGIAETVLASLIIGQILFRVVSKQPNEPMRRLGRQVSDYLYQVLLYLSFNSDEKPFPYQPWASRQEQHIAIPGAGRSGNN